MILSEAEIERKLAAGTPLDLAWTQTVLTSHEELRQQAATAIFLLEVASGGSFHRQIRDFLASLGE